MNPRRAMPRNPFLLMIDPESVLEAVARSERLSRLDRHLCRPLDGPDPSEDGAAEASNTDGGRAKEATMAERG